MPLHNAVGVNVKGAQLLNMTTQVPSVWAKGCVLDNCAYIIRLDVTRILLLMQGEGHGIYIIIIIFLVLGGKLNTDVLKYSACVS